MVGDDSTTRPPVRPPGRRKDQPLEGLRRLGDDAPGDGARRVANEEGLAALSDGPPARRPRRRASTSVRRRRWIAAGIAAVLLVVAVFGGSWLYLNWRFGQIPKVDVAAEQAVIAGQPFNVLVVGSDSRSGLTGQIAAQAQSAANPVTGQRSDVVMIWHLDPKHHTASILSIPRDTMVTMSSVPQLASAVGTFNRINSSFGSGPNDLVSVIEHNFGIPINHVVQVDFAGFAGAVDALGGVWMDFPNPARDAYSGLNITQTGCQLLNGTQALAVARSRHYEYAAFGQWYSDPTSDFGRIKRQGVFLRAMIESAKSKYNPLTFNAFLGSIPHGMVIDSHFGLSELIGLAMAYHSINPAALVTQTLPTQGVNGTRWGSVLFVDQPAAQQMLVDTYGAALERPSTPPPDPALQTPQPPVVTTTTVPAARAAAAVSGPAGQPAHRVVLVDDTAPGEPTNCSGR
jgi:LCP family protein required for cell wall assembly